MLCDLIGYQTIKRGCSRSILFWIGKSAPLNRCQTLTRWPRSHSIQFHPIFEAEIPREEIESNGEETANKKIRNTRFVYIYIRGSRRIHWFERAHFHHIFALYASKSNNNRTVYICMRIDSRFQMNTRVYGATQGVSNLANVSFL